jgi:hypothetical protein
VWADTLLRGEQAYLLRLFVWAALSVLGGTAILAILLVRRIPAALLRQFAIQLTLWGVVIAFIAALRWHGLHLRDLAGATRLERMTWLNIGLDAGFMGMGLVLIGAARRYAKSPGGIGAGAGILVHGAALLLLDVQFAAIVSR